MTANNNNECPQCFGSARCPACEFADSCRLVVRTDSDMDKPAVPGAQDFDEVSEWAPDLADYSHIPGEQPEDDLEPRNVSRQSLAALLTYLLHLDDYTLGILAEIIGPDRPGRMTAAQLARVRGCSRQRMHLKLLEIAERHPELRPMLKLALLKIRKARSAFLPRKKRAAALFIQTGLFDE